MRKSLLLIAVLGTFAVPAMAEEMAAAAAEPASPHTFTYNVGLYSQYIFRGLTQTGKEPALQGGVDYSHSSGFYLGAWGSNISWISDAGIKKDSSLEIDVYGGYKNTIGDTGITYDVGALQYFYPGNSLSKTNLSAAGFNDPNTTELYGALGWKWITAKYSHVVSGGAFGVPDGRNTYYAELNAAYPIGETGYSIIGHAGHQEFDGTTAVSGLDNDRTYSYSDYKLGATKSWTNGINVGGYYTTTTAKDAGWKNAGTNNRNLGADAFTFFVQKTF